MADRVNNNKIEQMYDRFSDGFLGELRTDDFFAFFMNALKSGERNVYLYEKYIERTVDLDWVEMIEQTIIPLDAIIRNPRRFIKNEEEILPIEMVRNVTTDSIKHLAQHTNMIATVKGDEVTPQRMLNIHKEESFETYENRFIYTLLQKLQYFLDKRLQALMAKTGSQDMLEMRLDGNFETGKDQVAYKLEFSYTTPHIDLAEEDLKINADVSQLSSMQRVERIRRILYDFMGSYLIRTLEGCALVRPPLTMTNVLTKNQDFKKAVELWMFIERYEDQGFYVKQVEREAIPSEKFLDDMFSVIALQYVISKNNSGRTEEHDDYAERRVEILPNIVRRDIEKIIENYDLEIEEIKRIFIESAEAAQKKKYDDTAKAEGVLARAMTLENTRMALDSKHRLTRADRVALKQELDRQNAEREAELKRARTEFLERETSRIENEVRAKFEAIALERDAARRLAEEEEARIRREARLAQEAEAKRALDETIAIRTEERLAIEQAMLEREEEEARIRLEQRLAREEEEARIRLEERLAKEEAEALDREARRLAKEIEDAKVRETARIAKEEEAARRREAARIAREEEMAELAKAASIATVEPEGEPEPEPEVVDDIDDIDASEEEAIDIEIPEEDEIEELEEEIPAEEESEELEEEIPEEDEIEELEEEIPAEEESEELEEEIPEEDEVEELEEEIPEEEESEELEEEVPAEDEVEELEEEILAEEESEELEEEIPEEEESEELAEEIPAEEESEELEEEIPAEEESEELEEEIPEEEESEELEEEVPAEDEVEELEEEISEEDESEELEEEIPAEDEVEELEEEILAEDEIEELEEEISEEEEENEDDGSAQSYYAPYDPYQPYQPYQPADNARDPEGE